MTYLDIKITKSQFFDISCKLDINQFTVNDKIQHIRRILKEKGKKVQCFNGKGLISLILPDNLNYEKKNNANPEEPVVRIYKGVLYEGTIDKNIVGSAHNSLIHIMFKEYGENEAAKFINNMHFVTNNWLTITSFSIGLGDCIISSKIDPSTGVSKQQEIKDVIQKCYLESETIKETTNHPGIREVRINAALNKARDVGLRLAKESLAPDNNFLSTVRSGSKGDFFNIAQITGLLGQQNIKGKRIPMTLNNSKRTLYHYPFEIKEAELDYESRGFVTSSFINGLNPKEFYFHAICGRDAVSDTALGTSVTGYLQRRIVKLMEDMKIAYDGTVRDINGRIFQAAYNEDNMNPTMLAKVGDSLDFCDVSRLVEKLNQEYEKNMNI